jgi:hypothetical protein
MPSYPLNVIEKTPGVFQASWADFPDVAAAEADRLQDAVSTLMARSMDEVCSRIAAGECPEPSPANGRMTIAISKPMSLMPDHLRNVVGITPAGNVMATYSWTNDLSYVE